MRGDERLARGTKLSLLSFSFVLRSEGKGE